MQLLAPRSTCISQAKYIRRLPRISVPCAQRVHVPLREDLADRVVGDDRGSSPSDAMSHRPVCPNTSAVCSVREVAHSASGSPLVSPEPGIRRDSALSPELAHRPGKFPEAMVTAAGDDAASNGEDRGGH